MTANIHYSGYFKDGYLNFLNKYKQSEEYYVRMGVIYIILGPLLDFYIWLFFNFI